ncbi:MAG: phospho-sugar mutase [Bacteroidales bacterium]|nr:phospho-sugar mutase [Bacteroidales bacterium]
MKDLDKNITERVNQWLTEDYDDETKATIRKMLESGSKEELTDAFYRDLEFGTGGLRGIVGVGTNRVNKYTIGAATQGLSNYLKKQYPDQPIKVALAHDNRNFAEYFTQVTADVFSANGIYVYFFDGLRPTPELSFAIRHFDCQSGVMLTASHNPKEYSGYKAYWNDGGQIIAPHDTNIIDEVLKIDSISKINFKAKPENIEKIGREIDELFIEKVKLVSLNPDVIKKRHDLKIVFSPLHGTGVHLVPEGLKSIGFTNVNLVEEQCVIDGNFPTVIYPNPEEKEALTMALDKAKQIDADLVMATDPDADRVGIAVKDDNNEFVLLNGNQTGTLLFHYLLDQWKQKNMLKGKEYIVKTIVTTYLIDRIAEAMGVKCYNVLTGFKFIGSLMTELEGKETFIAGAEESYGYLIGDHVRDKDAVVACNMIAEMTAWHLNNGKTPWQMLKEIYAEYGFFKEELISITKSGKKGAEEIKEMMTGFRENPPKSLGGKKVVKTMDYQTSLEKDLKTGKTTEIDLPKSNVLQFLTEGGNLISARPSGTEPKIKFYISVNTPLDAPENYYEKEKELKDLIQAIKKDLS